MPGASSASGSCRPVRRLDARARARARSASRGAPPGRSNSGRSSRQRWSIRRRQASARHRGSDRSGRRRSSSTCAAVVGETWPERLADGATTGLPSARMMPRATAWSGTRTAMLSSPAVASSATGQPAVSSAPASAVPARTPRQAASPPHRTPRGVRAAAMSDTCAISGLNGRPSLGGVKARHGLAVGGVGAEAVDRLGRKRDQPARGEAARRFRDGVVVRGKDAGRELGGHLLDRFALA